MRISVFLNKDLESNIALNGMLPTLAQHQFNIYLSENIGTQNNPIRPLQQLAFLEREFITQHLFPFLEARSDNDFLSFDQISKKYKVELMVLNEVTSQDTLSHISSFRPDLFISIRFGKIFKGEVLSIPPLGIINLHSAILPAYKGVLGTFRAMLHGDREIGSTIHYITDNSIDTGNIICIDRAPVVPEKSVLWHVVNLYPVAVNELCTIINNLSASQKIKSTPQPSGGNYYTFPTLDDIHRLEKKTRLFDLSEYAELLQTHYAVSHDWVMDEVSRLPPFRMTINR